MHPELKMKVRERYPNAIAEQEDNNYWTIWDKPSPDNSVIPFGHIVEISMLLGQGETESEAWTDANQKLKRR